MDFILAGTMRSGSSSFYRHLSKHPDILTFEDKEVGYYLGGFEYENDSDKITGDGSVYYFTRQKAIDNIYKESPNIKLIFLFRHPTDRAWSHYWMNKRVDIKDNFAVITNSLYLRHTRRWLKKFSRDQMLFIKSEDYYEDENYWVNEAFDFLGVSECETSSWHYVNEYATIDNRDRLDSFFEKHNDGLEDITGFNWF